MRGEGDDGYRVIDVTLEPADGDPSRSTRSVLRGAYA